MGGLPICQVHSASCWVGGLCSSSGGSRGILHLGAQSLAQGSQNLDQPVPCLRHPAFRRRVEAVALQPRSVCLKFSKP